MKTTDNNKPLKKILSQKTWLMYSISSRDENWKAKEVG